MLSVPVRGPLPISCRMMSPTRHTSTAPTRTATHPGGGRIDRHRHDEHQLVYVSSGVIAATTAAGTWVAGRERAVWVPAGVWHEHRFHGASAMHTVGFPRTTSVLPGDAPAVVPVDTLLGSLVVACTEPDLDEAERDRLRGVIADRLRRARQRPLVVATPRDPRLVQACDLVQADLRTPLTLAELAGRVHVGERTLSRLFREDLGTTYLRWRARVRVYRAMVLLTEGASVTSVAGRCGWATPSAFVDTFGRVTGQTPGRYRTGPG